MNKSVTCNNLDNAIDIKMSKKKRTFQEENIVKCNLYKIYFGRV